MIGREEMVEVGGIATYTLTLGRGPPLVVAHGGPGFDHGYLVATLESLAERRTLIFYDQPGCGRTPAPAGGVSAEATYRHFAALVDGLRAPGIGLLAHSWGALVALGAAAGGMRRRFEEGLLITPVPTRRALFDQVSANLFARFPPGVAERYAQLVAEGNEVELVELVLPYYLATPRPAPEIGLRVRLATFLEVFPRLGDFDFRRQVGIFERCGVLIADRDLTPAHLVADILAAASRRFDLSGVGHFPGHEDPRGFATILETAFPPGGRSAHSST